MVENMHLRLQLVNHDSKVKKMLSDIHMKDSEIVQAARDRVENLMKQALVCLCFLFIKEDLCIFLVCLSKYMKQNEFT
jgi:hypothetical protein